MSQSQKSPQFSHLPITTDYFKSVTFEEGKGLVITSTDDDGNVTETVVDPRIPVLVSKFNELVDRRSDKNNVNKPGVKAYASKTMTRIIKGVETIDPSFVGLPEMQAHLSVSTAKDSVLSDLLSDLGV